MRSALAFSVAALVTCGCAATALAVPYTTPNGLQLDIEYWAGTGANETYLVVDFRQGPDDVYTFGYRWDGVADAGDALVAVADAGALDVGVTNWGGPPPAENLFVDWIEYYGTRLETRWVGPGDWDYEYWSYWFDEVVGPGESVEWAAALDIGMSGHTLVNQGFEGWVFAYQPWPPETPPRQPRQGQEDVPEPCTLLLLALGGCPLALRRWSRRCGTPRCRPQRGPLGS